MSQRGSHRNAVHPSSRPRWTQLYNCIAISLILLFGFTFTLTAQTPTPSPTTALSVIVRVDGGERQATCQGGTVADLLKQMNLTLDPHDIVTPALTTAVTHGMQVKVERVVFEIVTEKLDVQPPVVTRWDNRVTANPVTLRLGLPGVATQKRCMWKKDGVVAVQWTQSYTVVQAPTPTIVVRGNQASRAGLTGRRVMRVVATGYDPGPGSCGPNASGHTAIGMHATRGVIAVDPRVIPLGSRVYIDGYGPAIAADVGGAIKGNRIDVCFPTRAEALRWGRKTVDIVILQ